MTTIFDYQFNNMNRISLDSTDQSQNNGAAVAGGSGVVIFVVTTASSNVMIG